MAYYVYMLRCADKSLYTGIALDPRRRFAAHRAGKGGHYTRAHPPERIVYQELCGSRSDALKREAELKRLSRTGKLALIQSASR